MAPNLMVAGDELIATWIEKGGKLRTASNRHGRWGASQTIVDDPLLVANWADVPVATSGGDGISIAFAVAPDPTKDGYDLQLARGVGRPRRWRSLGRVHGDATPTEHGFSSFADRYAFWLDGRGTLSGGPTTLRTRVIAGGPERILDPRVCDCCGTSAVATPTGAAIVYRGRTDDETRDIRIARLGPAGWAAPVPVHDDGWRVPGCPVNGPEIDAHGEALVVAWFSYAGERSRVLAAFGSTALGDPVVVDGPSGRSAPIGRVDVVALSATEALVSWVRSDRESAQIVVRRVGSDGRVGEPVKIAETRAGRESGFPKMVRTGADVVFAWTQPGEPTRVRAARLAVSEVPPVAERAADSAASAPRLAALGSAAPDYTAKALDGAPVSLSGLRGRPALVNLWATWCEPCRHEIRDLATLHERFSARGLSIVGISVDAQATADDLRAFAQRRSIPYAVWRDPDDRASRAFGVETLPANFLLDGSGTVVWRKSGALRADDPDLVAAIERLVAAD